MAVAAAAVAAAVAAAAALLMGWGGVGWEGGGFGGRTAQTQGGEGGRRGIQEVGGAKHGVLCSIEMRAVLCFGWMRYERAVALSSLGLLLEEQVPQG